MFSPTPLHPISPPIVHNFDAVFCWYTDHGRIYVPKAWQEGMEEADHWWVAKQLFRWSGDNKPILDEAKVTCLWFQPPTPAPCPSVPPRPQLYFAKRLCAWFPSRLWRYAFFCDKAECARREMTRAGLYSTVRKVLLTLVSVHFLVVHVRAIRFSPFFITDDAILSFLIAFLF